MKKGRPTLVAVELSGASRCSFPQDDTRLTPVGWGVRVTHVSPVGWGVSLASAGRPSVYVFQPLFFLTLSWFPSVSESCRKKDPWKQLV